MSHRAEQGERRPLLSGPPADELEPATTPTPAMLRRLTEYSSKGLPNLRDLHKAFEALRPGVVFRSSTLANADGWDQQHILSTLGVHTIVDLRHHAEARLDGGSGWVDSHYPTHTGGKHGPPAQPANANVTASTTNSTANTGTTSRRVFVPFVSRMAMFWGIFQRMRWRPRLLLLWYGLLGVCFPHYKARAKTLVLETMNRVHLRGLNEVFLDQSGAQIVAALRVIAEPGNHPVLINCAHGKDRTGLLSALVLRVCGASSEMIVADYTASDAYGRTDEARDKFKALPQLDAVTWSRAEPATMHHTLRYLETRYGSVALYLAKQGFAVHEQDALRCALLRPA